jgi:glucose/mannose transport system permease protein
MGKKNIPYYIFLVPAFVLIGIFTYVFTGLTGYFSLLDWRSLGQPGEFIGLQNYYEFINNPIAMKALVNTVILSSLFIILTTVVGLCLAILLDIGSKAAGLFRTIFLLPLSFSFVISATMWVWMFAPNQGTINSLLRLLNLDFLTQPWITSTQQSLLCVLIVYIWQFSGFATLIYYAGIRGIPQEQLESALIDGATTLQKYVHVIIPQLKGETIGVVTIFLFYALRVFDLVYLLTGGGPSLSSEVLATYMYRVTFNQNLFAYGASVGFIIFLLAIGVMVPFLYLTSGRWRR